MTTIVRSGTADEGGRYRVRPIGSETEIEPGLTPSQTVLAEVVMASPPGELLRIDSATTMQSEGDPRPGERG